MTKEFGIFHEANDGRGSGSNGSGQTTRPEVSPKVAQEIVALLLKKKKRAGKNEKDLGPQSTTK